MDEHKKQKAKNIETYAEDMASAIRGGEHGLIKKMIHEQETSEEEKKRLSPDSQKNRLFSLFGAGLIISAVVLLVFFGAFERDTGSVYVPPQFEPIVFTDSTEFIDVTELEKEAIYNLVRAKANDFPLSPAQVSGIYLAENKKVIDFARFMTLIQGNFPSDKMEVVQGNFLIGIFGKEEAEGRSSGDVFVILKVKSFLDIFDAMRRWEDKLILDVAGLFGMNISGGPDSLLLKGFEDGFVENKNARILHDDLGNVVFMYIFADNNSIIITSSLPAAQDALLRLSAGDIRK